MRLFEGGVLEKITSDEYERMYKNMQNIVEATDESFSSSGKKETSKSDENRKKTRR